MPRPTPLALAFAGGCRPRPRVSHPRGPDRPVPGPLRRLLARWAAAAWVGGLGAVALPAMAGPNENLALVRAFIQDVFVARNPEAARRYLAEDYLQHNPQVAPGREGFVSSLREWFAQAPADLREEPLHLLVDGDWVLVHQRLRFTGKDGQPHQVRGFDLYRVQSGHIVEHWDSDPGA